MNCKSCGAKLKAGAKFCHACGSVVEGNENANYNYNVNNNQPVNTEEPADGLAIASVVLGGISFFVGVIIVILPIVGLILGICSKKKHTLKTVGIILNSVSLGLIVLLWIFIFGIFSLTAKSVEGFQDKIMNEEYREKIEHRLEEEFDEFDDYLEENTTDENTDESSIEENIG